MSDPRSAHRRRLVLASLVVVLVFVAVFGLWSPESLSQAPETLAPVVVTNFPQIQEVQGSVSIRGLVPHTRFVEPARDIVVSPVQRTQISDLIEGGVLETDGFARLTLSLAGLVKGNVRSPGKLGALLVPDVEIARDALLEEEIYLFPVEVTAELTRASTFVASDSVVVDVAFPRYRVYFYNSSDRAVAARLFGYLSY
jgi:hypothetical protein